MCRYPRSSACRTARYPESPVSCQVPRPTSGRSTPPGSVTLRLSSERVMPRNLRRVASQPPAHPPSASAAPDPTGASGTPARLPLARFKDLCLDAADALPLAAFWAQAIGATLVEHGDGSARLTPGPGRPENELIWVDPVPEPRTGKTRLHVDIRLADRDAGLAALVAAGASVRREPDGDIHWWVLADPDGNEFCAFEPRKDTPREEDTPREDEP